MLTTLLRRPFYGWYIVGMAFISLFMGASTGGFTFSIFLPAMNADLGWSRSTIVFASSLCAITSAVAGPWLGRLVDRRGPRLVLIACVVSMSVALFTCGFVDAPWQFYLAFGLLGGVSRSALQSVVPGSMIASWFVRRRSAAYGMAAMGPPISNLLLPPIVTAVVAAHGWRAGWMAMGLIEISIGLLPSLIIRRRRPQEIGQLPDGDLPKASAAGPDRKAVPAPDQEDWTASEAIHSPAFWMIAAGMALILLAPNVSLVFMFSYLSDKGVSPHAAATTISAVSAMQVLSRMVFWAPVIPRLGSVRWALVLWGSLLLCSSLLLALAPNEIWAYAAAGVLGTAMGGNLVLQLQVWPEYFGRAAVGTIIGTGQLFQGVTSSVLPLLLAGLLDQTGSYTLLYGTVSALVFIGVLLHARVGRPRRPARVKA